MSADVGTKVSVGLIGLARGAARWAVALVLAWGALAPGATTFDIQNEGDYQKFKGALTAAQIVLYEQSQAPNQRVLAVLAGASELARQNPQAGAEQLSAFASAYDAALAGAFAGDPDLRRRGHLRAAVRFVARVDATSEDLAGLRLDVGEGALRAMGLESGGATHRQRSIEHQRSQVENPAGNAKTSTLLVHGFMDTAWDASPRPGLGEAMAGYLRSRGIEPFPAPGALATQYPELSAALGTMPADYAAFAAARAGDFADAKSQSLAELAAVRANIDEKMAAIADELATDGGAGLWQRYDPTPDPALLAQLGQRLAAEARERAGQRARLTMNNFLQAQALAPGVRIGASQLDELASLTLETDETTGRVSAGLSIAGGLIGAGVAFATEGPGAIVGGVGLLLGVASSVVDLVGDETGPPPPEQQIFDQITALRAQVEELRLEMHARFDAIDRQLEVIYGTMIDSFNQINETLRRVEGSLSEIQVSLYGVRSAINRLEANLYGVLADGFQQDLLIDMDFALGHRARTGFDLAYAGAGGSTYSSFESTFYTWATTIAGDSGHAGPTSPNLAYATSAIDQLGNFPLGFNINNLRQLPTQLGLPSLSSQRLVDPTTWSFVADAYAQLARENPWYFAAINQSSPQRLNDIIAKGESVRDAMRGAKSLPLYDRLLDDFDARTPTLADQLVVRNNQVIPSMFPELAPLNVWLDEDQPIEQFDDPPVGLPSFSRAIVQDPSGNSNQYQLSAPGGARFWGLVHPSIGIALHLRLPVPDLVRASSPPAAHESFTHSCQVVVDHAPDGPSNEFVITYTWGVRWRSRQIAWVRNTVRARGTDIFAMEYWALDQWNGQIAPTWFDPPGTTYNFAGTIRLLRKVDSSTQLFPQNFEEITLAARDAMASRRLQAASVLLGAMDQAGTLRDAIDSAHVPVAMLDAYLSLGAPESMVVSDVLRAGVKGGATAGGTDGLGGLADGSIRELLLGGSNVDFASAAHITDALRRRSDAVRAEIHAMIPSGSESHDYLTWSIAGLRDLRTLGQRLSVPDRYDASPDQTLGVPSGAGVLSNDAAQGPDLLRSAILDTPPAHGTLSLHADGSFTYTPTPGFTGVDSFAYHARASIGVAGQQPINVNGNVASVFLLVGGAACPADLDDGTFTGASDGGVTIDDLLYFLDAFENGSLAADLDDGTSTGSRDGGVTIDDLIYFLEHFELGC